MRISLLSPGITPYVMGGLQRHSFNLARYLARLGVEVDLYHTDFSEAKHINDLEGMTDTEKEKIFSIAIPWGQRDRFIGHYIRELKQFSNEAYRHYQKRPASEFIIGASLTAWAFTKAKHRGIELPPIGVSLHGFEMFQASANVRASIENWVLRPSFYRHSREADYLFSFGGRITELIKNHLNISEERIIEIPGGVDTSWLVEKAKVPSACVRFVFLGRYERRKGIEELQASIRSNPGWENCAEFRFIGPIPVDKFLSLPHVSYAGSISDDNLLKRELRQADVIVCPSHSEGMPNVILEGMASGLAVLATDVGAVRLMVSEQNGILLSRVTTQGLTHAINSLLDLDSNKLFLMKQNSIARARAFEWEKISLKTLEVMRTIVEDKRTCQP